MEEIIALPGKRVNVARNDYLKRQGSVDTNVYFIEKGSLRLFILHEEAEQTLRFGYANNIMVSLDSFLTGRPSDYCIQAIKKTVVKVISKQTFDHFLETTHNRIWWRDTLENLVLQQMEREIDLLTHSPRERYERVLKRSPQLFQEIPHRHIANYLRMSPETLSRLQKS